MPRHTGTSIGDFRVDGASFAPENDVCAGLVIAEGHGTTIIHSRSLSMSKDAAAALLDLFGRQRNGKGRAR